MTGDARLDIQVLPAAAAEDTATMTRIAGLVNEVYAVAEKGQWLPGATRTSVAEITDLTRAGQIVVARLGGEIVGSIRVQHLDATTGETGMLVADPRHRGHGIGRRLRSFVRDMLRRDGITTLQIELLVPRDWTQESKAFMADWNARDGFEVVRRGAFEDQYPDLAPLLATPCDFIIYNRPL